LSPPRIYLALVHFPVVNREGEIIASAVTNLDLHDLARIACTYGAQRFYVVTPLADQQTLVRRIVDHWTEGFGAAHNPDRRRAMRGIRLCQTLADAAEAIRERDGQRPLVVATCARPGTRRMTVGRLKTLIADGRPCLLVFGTASGLAEAPLEDADEILAPIRGVGDYNHLPVRAAAAVVLDRLVGEREA
jgi:hypothetical protein